MTAQITTDVAACAEALKRGELVAFGTETVYGLGANALDASAVAQIFAAKSRPAFDPLIVHVADVQQVADIAEVTHPALPTLMQRFWPGPLTLLLPRRSCVPDLVTSGLPEVGIRIPAHEQARQLLRQAGVPVAAPSANLFGQISPTTAQHVADQLEDRIHWILDGGPCAVGVESTVLRLPTQGSAQVLRPGGTTLESLREVLGEVELAPSLLDGEHPAAPGQLHAHYAPRTPLQLVQDWTALPSQSEVGVLCFRTLPSQFHGSAPRHCEVLSPTGELAIAATQLFAALRRLDESGCRLILAETVPQYGLGVAINDRLRRAAAGH